MPTNTHTCTESDTHTLEHLYTLIHELSHSHAQVQTQKHRHSLTFMNYTAILALRPNNYLWDVGVFDAHSPNCSLVL